MFKFIIAALVVRLHLTSIIAFEIQPRIKGGNQAHSGQFPYFVHFEVYLGTEYEPEVKHFVSLCGAAIISNKWILTAAHCLDDAIFLNVYFGSNNLDEAKLSNEVMTITRDNFHIHPAYDEVSNDIALMKLPYEIKFSTKIQPARMPTACEAPQHGAAIAMGYGGWTPQLQYAVMDIRPSDIYCNIYQSIKWDDSLICAFDFISQQSTCYGDSGSPLITLSDNTLIGILNFGPVDRHRIGYPEGFASVPYYLKWIKNITGLELVDC